MKSEKLALVIHLLLFGIFGLLGFTSKAQSGTYDALLSGFITPKKMFQQDEFRNNTSGSW